MTTDVRQTLPRVRQEAGAFRAITIGGSFGTPRSTAAESRNETASATSAPRMPSVATKRPPSSGPIATCMFSAVPSHAFAESRSSSSTIAGMALRPAGVKIVSRTEAEATRTMRPGSPGRSHAAMAKMATRPRSHAIMSRR